METVVVAGEKLRWRSLVEAACVVKLSEEGTLRENPIVLAAAASITLAVSHSPEQARLLILTGGDGQTPQFP